MFQMPVGLVRLAAGLFLIWLCAVCEAKAQCESAAETCTGSLAPFQPVSGAYFRAELFPFASAKLRIQFEFDRVYRIVPCGTSDRNARLVFNLYDRAGVLVYSSSSSPDRSVFEFDFGVSGQYTIVAGFEQGGGCAALLIGSTAKDAAPADVAQRIIHLGRP